MAAIEGGGRAGGAFRPDLEGLRAVAVALVVLYHADLLGLRGGFVGVDVFYVLSGFFITGILLREHAASGRISLPAFYARRMRRLLPAAGATIVATVVASWLILPPLRFAIVGRDAIASALYVSNIRFAQFATDYLHAGGAPSPFLHFWSLGVEEQFYALFPLFLIALFALGARSRGLGIALLAVVAGSIAVSVWLTSYSQPWAFFTLPARAFELGFGALLALYAGRLPNLPAPLRLALGWGGLAAVLASGWLLGAGTPFPGYAALLPTLGTAAVIVGGTPVPLGVGGPLSVRPFRAIGRWSYSLYLVHWPLLTLPVAALDRTLTVGERVGLVAAAVALAAFSYRFVETPVRGSRRLALRPRYGLAAGIAISAAAALSGAALVLAQGPSGIGTAAPPTANGIAAGAATRVVPANLVPALGSAQGDSPVVYSDGCHLSFGGTTSPPCAFGDTAAKRTIVLFGDSHAAQWFPALDDVARQHGFRLESLTKSACPATTATLPNPIGGGSYDACTTWHRRILARLAREHPAVVVVSSLIPLDGGAGRTWLAGWGRMVAELRRRAGRVIVLGDVPRPRENVPNCLSAHIRDVPACTTTRSRAVDAALWRRVEQETTANGGDYVATDRWVCPGTVCPVIAGNLLLYRDDTHLTLEFVDLLEPRLARALAPDLR